ncbi:hypothetical protein P154DRAFT_51224 [Amniculicola lignicola CBS 123094]|uniref:Uncharacterized protein n=1 Tax=Amniculicola lignicola CBS 123094 TaxID=1392246 RepID=A0A6A5WRN4_9PLEO|nr:hypothetical protein P154DRAFT_51224 [Amniculicola lignicola CBS 123094]
MPSLLSIPCELRDEIIDIVINDVRTIRLPGDVDVERKERSNFCEYLQEDETTFRSDIQHPVDPTAYQTNTIGLLLTNHQLHSETEDRLRNKPTRYFLDVFLVEEAELWPTWTSIPRLDNRVDTLDVTFRIAHPPREQGGRGGLSDLNPMSSAFEKLLQVFFRFGPVIPSIKEPEFHDKFISVRRVHFNFVTATNLSESLGIFPAYVGKNPRGLERILKTATKHELFPAWYEKGKRYLMHPQTLATILKDYLDLVVANRTLQRQYGDQLFRRVGEIQFIIDGTEFHRWDMASQLSKGPTVGSDQWFGRGFEDMYQLWRREVIAVRNELGFPVPIEKSH